jgi:hypothetical protein
MKPETAKRTALEWLEYEFVKLESTIGVHSSMYHLIEKAMVIEKEQIRTILLAYQEERNGQSDGAQNKWEPYEVDEFLENYNETFNTDEK